ncbi:MAG: hypothetical protein KDB92_13490, partial [Chitinophagaceae bacterium]|nr:hypothetical protein [Chitinophagaceae bacterium]
AHFNGTNWDSYGNSGGTTGNVSTGSVTWNGVSTFSPFSLGSTDPAENPLPVKLINVKAYQLGSVNKIEWTNLTEIDVEKYEVEKSTDGIHFATMSTQSPKANAGGSESYDATDAQQLPVNFYRVKVTAINGEITYSQIMKLANNANTGQKISLYPNPVTQQQFTLQMT